MEPACLELSLVPGTAGTYAVAFSRRWRDWLVFRHMSQPKGHPYWLWVATSDTEEKALSLAVQSYDEETRWTVAP